MLPKRARPSLVVVLALLGAGASLMLIPAMSTPGSAAGPGGPQDELTFHNDAQRTGWYRAETTLTPAKVKSGFGLIGSLQVPGKVYAQPLYVTNETTKDGKSHNLVIIATATDQMYAVDDKTNQLVWYRNFTPAGVRQQLWDDFPGPPPNNFSRCQDMSPDLGITGTPVIDRSLDSLFVVVATKEGANFHMRIHAVSLKDGTDVAHVGPTEVTDNANNPLVNPLYNNQRAALLESNGNIYVALADHCDWHTNVTHGWLLSFSAKTLQPTGNLNTTKSGYYFLGSPWMAGYGPAADAAGNVYFATGNGAFDGLTSFSMAVMKVPPNLDITKASYFVPPTWSQDSANDDDLGSGGVMLLPDQPGSHPHLIVFGGKCNTANTCMKYMLDRDQLGYLAGQSPNPATSPVLATPAPVLWQADTGGPLRGGPAYFADASGKQIVYYGGGTPPPRFPTRPGSTPPPGTVNQPYLSAYTLGSSPMPNLSPAASASYGPSCLQCREGGSQPVVSSNGTQANTAIVWVIQTPTGWGYPLPTATGIGVGGPAIPLSLWAFDAETMTTLFHGPAASGTWALATGKGLPAYHQWQGAAMVSPLVANGKVYVPLQGAVAIFGLKASPSASPAPPVILPTPAASFARPEALRNARPSVPQQSVDGTITQLTGNTFVLRGLDGRTVRVDGSAAAKTGSTVRLMVGVRVYCTGRTGSDGLFRAVAIQYLRG